VSSYSPNDLVTDLDLRAYERDVLQKYATNSWAEKRAKALQDWLWPQLRSQGFAPEKFRTRYEPDSVLGFTGAAFSDVKGAAVSLDADDLNLATIFASVGSDALFVGDTQPFRGLSLRMGDTPTSTANVVTVSYWADSWVALTITDKTQGTAGTSFSKGGSFTWAVPDDWTLRKVHTVERRYWVKVTTSVTPASAKAGQLGVIRHSVLAAPVTFWTLALIMREAPTTSGAGPWREKAEYYEQQAAAALQRAYPSLGGEFESDDPITDQISDEEAEQTTETVTGGPWRLERA
jgi:hypothetical protein